MFKTCSNKGFSIKFENGNTVSVQWGPQNYCDPTHREGRDADSREPMRGESWASETAEVAAWDSDGNWHHFGYDSVEGWRTGIRLPSLSISSQTINWRPKVRQPRIQSTRTPKSLSPDPS